MKTKNNKEIYMGSYGYLNIKTSEIVESKNQLRLKTGDDKYEILEVKISADFSTIPVPVS